MLLLYNQVIFNHDHHRLTFTQIQDLTQTVNEQNSKIKHLEALVAGQPTIQPAAEELPTSPKPPQDIAKPILEPNPDQMYVSLAAPFH